MSAFFILCLGWKKNIMKRTQFFGIFAILSAIAYLLVVESTESRPDTPNPFHPIVSAASPSFVSSQRVPSRDGALSQSKDIQKGSFNPANRDGEFASGANAATIDIPSHSPTSTVYSTGAKNFERDSGSTKPTHFQNVKNHSGVIQEGGLREITISVPEGAMVPAVFFDAVEKPLVQQKALDRIVKEFEKNVSVIPQGLTKEEVWEAARKSADERFLTLFGYQAFNQYHIQAAKEALKEKRANSKGP